MRMLRKAPRSNGWRGRVIGTATAKTGSFAITVNWDTVGVIVAVDLERGVPVWDETAAGTAMIQSPLEKHYGR
jgi:hypothetical protein